MGTQEMNGRPSFFKVLIGNFTNELRIPINFVKNFHGMIPVDAILRSPTGRCWTVKVAENEDGLIFREGWPDFVRKHGLEFGDFITIKYLGNSQFKVRLFARNGCEKELHLSHKKRRFAETSSKCGQGNMQSDPSCCEKHKRGLGKHVEPKRGTRVVNDERKRAVGKEKRRDEDDDVEWLNPPNSQTPVDWRKKVIPGDKDQETVGNRKMPSLPPHFHYSEQGKKRKKRSGSLTPSKRPYKINKSEETWKKKERSKLDVPNQIERRENSTYAFKTGGVSIDSRDPNRASQNKTRELRARLPIPPGQEVTVFNRSEPTKSLHIDETDLPYSRQERRTRSSEESSTCPGKIKSEADQEDGEGTSNLPTASSIHSNLSCKIDRREQAAQLADSFKSRFPFFAVFIGATYQSQAYMHVPNSFAYKHLPMSINKIIVRSSDNRAWPIKYSVNGRASNLSRGWTHLRRGLGLEEGDVCVFELTKKKPTGMRVSIFRVINDVLTRI